MQFAILTENDSGSRMNQGFSTQIFDSNIGNKSFLENFFLIAWNTVSYQKNLLLKIIQYSAAMEACKQLRSIDELDENMMPLGREPPKSHFRSNTATSASGVTSQAQWL